jgi:hypothetical protein
VWNIVVEIEAAELLELSGNSSMIMTLENRFEVWSMARIFVSVSE